MTDDPPPIPAATLVLFRPAADGGADEVLMLERAGSLAFAAGALVFPGGRVDPGDHALAGGDEELAARFAVVRETIEEAGIAVALDPEPDRVVREGLRAGLQDGRDLGALLAEAGLRAMPERLVPFARWRPPGGHVRVFDTRFYLGEAPAGAEALVDGGECVGAVWARPADILAEADAGRRQIIFPTRRNLERLAQFAGFAEAAADARLRAAVTIQPWTEMRDGIEWMAIPDGIGYPVTAERMATVRRA